MKKLLVLALAVVLTLSLAVVASAATFDPYVGGRITWAYISSDGTENNPVTYNNSGLKMLLQGKIKDDATGTWATIGAHLNNWGTGAPAGLADGLRDFGINNIAGSNVSAWYTNWENQNTKRGQDRIRDIAPAKFHSDPMFDHAPGNVLGVDYKTDSAAVNFIYSMNKSSDDADNLMIVAGTFNFDGGDVHVGYYTDEASNTDMNLGAVMKFGFGTIKADYVAYTPDGGDSVNQIQVNASLDAVKLDFTVLSDDKYTAAITGKDTFATDGCLGYQIRYSGLADGKVTLAYRALTANDDADEKDNMTDLYIGYKYGIFETRLGSATTGKDNDLVYAAVYASLW